MWIIRRWGKETMAAHEREAERWNRVPVEVGCTHACRRRIWLYRKRENLSVFREEDNGGNFQQAEKLGRGCKHSHLMASRVCGKESCQLKVANC